MVVQELTETGTTDEVHVTEESLLPKVREMKERGARFITVTTRDMGDKLEVIYHFEVNDRVENLYLKTPRGEPVQSITGEYLVAFIAENECQDLFGVEFKGLAVDFGGKMLKVEASPSTLLKPAEGPLPPIMRKLGKCREECPAMVDVPRYVRQVERGDAEGAYDTIIEQAPLPAILGRACFAPCQEGCRQELETKPIQIRLLKRYAADAFKEKHGGLQRDVERKPPTGRRVAVVGGIPGIVSDEERVMPKILHEFLIRVGSNSKSPYMEYFGIEKGFWMRFDIINESTHKALGFTTTCTNKYSVTSMDMTEYLLL